MSDAVVAVDVEIRREGRTAIATSSFRVPSAGLTVICGPNGSGKSTVLHAISGLVVPSSGSIEVLGTRPRRARRRVAYVLQASRANERLPITVREVVTMGRYAERGAFGRLGSSDRRRVDEALDRLSLTSLASRHLRELSGGERQRVFVAQGLVQGGDLLLLDEPLTGLDIPSRDRIEEVISDLRRDRPVVVTTHDLADAARGDHALLLAGRVVASGPPHEVLTTAHLTEAYGERVVQLPELSVLVDEDVHHPHR